MERNELTFINPQRYRTIRALSQKASSMVLLAKQVGLDRDVVLKVIHTDDPTVTRRFRREVRVLSMLRHPNNVRILDAGLIKANGRESLCLVTEFAEGYTLRQVLQHRRRLGIVRSIHVMKQVLRGLAEAHKLTIVHRDIKPENLMLSTHAGLKDHVHVIDYSVAFSDFHTSTLDSPDGVSGMVGTPHYMAPEVASGQPPTVHSDLYAVGVVLYECLSGQRPFDGTDPISVLYQQTHYPPVPVKQLVPISEALNAIVERALAKEPSARFQTAQELCALDLQEESTYELASTRPYAIQQELSTLDLEPGELNNAGTIQTGAVERALMSTHAPSAWVLTDDPGIDDGFAAMLRQHNGLEVTLLDGAERALAVASLRTGMVVAPWVVFFGDLHVILQDELLEMLGVTAETSKVLVSTHLNAEMLQTSVNFCGVDHSLVRPCGQQGIDQTLDIMLERGRTIRRQYDTLRLALRDARKDAMSIAQTMGVSSLHELGGR